MKNSIYLILFFIAFIIKTESQRSSLNDFQILNRNKRDACVGEASFNIISSSLETLSKYLEPKHTLSSVLGILGVVSQVKGAVFGFNTISSCDLNNQLKNVLDKLENLETVIKCESHKNYYRETLSKLEHLIDAYKQYSLRRDLFALNYTKIVCSDPSEGISKIYSIIKMLFRQSELIENVKNCCHYKIDCFNLLLKKLVSLATLFVTSLKFCEEAYEVKSDFDSSLFHRDIEKLINYFTQQEILKQFSIDVGSYGLRDSLQRLANKSVSLESFQKDYDFFDWQVVYVTDFIPFCYTEEKMLWNLKCTPRFSKWQNTDNVYCGSEYVFSKFTYTEIHALIAWCHKDISQKFNNDKILDYYDLQIDKDEIIKYVNEQTNKTGKVNNFVISVLKGGYFFNKIQPVEKFGDVNFKSISRIFRARYDTFWSLWYPKSEIQKPEFSQSAAILKSKNF